MSLLAGLSQQGDSMTASQISDAGTAGKAVLTAETQAQGREALGVNNLAPIDPYSGGLVAEYRLDVGSGPIVPNSVGGAGYAANRIPFPSTFSQGWTLVNVAVTDNYAPDPKLGAQGTRLVGTGYVMRSDIPMSAGAATASIWVQSNTGLVQKMRIFAAGGWGSDITIPATGWTRISRSFTATDGNAMIAFGADAASDSIDVIVFGAQAEMGALSAFQETGLVIKGSPAWVATGLDFSVSSNSCANGSLQPTKCDRLTLYSAFKWPSENASNSPSLVGLFGSYDVTQCLLAANYDYGPSAMLSNVRISAPLYGPNSVKDSAWHILAATSDGSATRLYIDGDLIQVNSETLAPALLSVMRIGDMNGTGFSFPGTIGWCSAYGVCHSAEQVWRETDQIRRIMTVRGAVLSAQSTGYVMFEGDSITSQGTPTYSATWPAVAKLGCAVAFNAANKALSGSKISHLNARASLIDSAIVASRGRNALVVLIGQNDLAVSSAATIVAGIKSYCLARRAAGWNRILVCTLTSSTTDETKRVAVNSAISADQSFYDWIIDFGANPIIGAVNAYTNLTYFTADGMHPTDAGKVVMGNVAAPVIAAALT